MSTKADSKVEEKNELNGYPQIQTKPNYVEELPPSNLRASIKCYSPLKHEKVTYNIRLHQITTKTIKFLFQLPNDSQFFLCDNDNNVEICNQSGQFLMCDENNKYNVEMVNKSPNELQSKNISQSLLQKEEQKKEEISKPIKQTINNNKPPPSQQPFTQQQSQQNIIQQQPVQQQKPPPNYTPQAFPFKDQYGRPCDDKGRTPSGIQILVDSKKKECFRDAKTGQIKYYRAEMHGKEKWLFNPDTNERLMY